MIRRDYLKDEIDRLGEFFRRILEKILDLPGDAPSEQMYREVDEGFTQLLNKSLKEALVLDNEEFLNMVVSETQHVKSMEVLAEIFYVLATKGDQSEMQARCLLKSLMLYKHVLENSATYSLEIHQKVSVIEELLDQLD